MSVHLISFLVQRATSGGCNGFQLHPPVFIFKYNIDALGAHVYNMVKR